jgi:parallel beta-helix repeat protein
MQYSSISSSLVVGAFLSISNAIAPTPAMAGEPRIPTLHAQAIGKTYYVSGTGNDNNTGLSPAQAFKTLQRAAELTEPGSTVFVLNGTYENADPNGVVLSINKSGTANAWIRYKAYPGQTPKIQVRNWAGISVNGASYITIEGFTIEGNRDELAGKLDYVWSQRNNLNNPITSGNCIGVAPKYQSNPEQRSHHIVIRKNTVFKCPGGGIYTMRADYVRVEDNVVWGNAYYAPYGNSGVSFYQNWNSDSSTRRKFFILRNIIYGNKNLIPFFYSSPNPSQRVITDGNGIIIDDSRNTQTQSGSTGEPYLGSTYIANNIVYENSARGIHVFSSDNVSIVNNTTYGNSSEPATSEGEITTICASKVNVYNNIMYARPDRPANTRIGTNQCTVGGADDKASQIYDYNLVFSGTGLDTTKFNNIIGRDPQFINLAARNFRLQLTSPAINAGSSAFYARQDFSGTTRPLGGGVDIGAFEVK